MQPDAENGQDQPSHSGQQPMANLAVGGTEFVAFLMAVQRRGGTGSHEEHGQGKQNSDGTIGHRTSRREAHGSLLQPIIA